MIFGLRKKQRKSDLFGSLFENPTPWTYVLRLLCQDTIYQNVSLFRYDVLVNGGGAVTLQFQRSPFKPLTKTVFVPWNQIVVLPPVQMYIGESGSDDSTAKSPRNATLPPDYFTRLGIYFENTIGFLSLDSCLDHSDVKPVIVSSWAPEKRGAMSGQSLALSDSQVSDGGYVCGGI